MYKILTTQGRAKRARFTTPHGVIETPVFMNVATDGAIKGALSAEDLERIGCQIALCNTYHLAVRPGDDVVYRLGGIRRFMDWQKPVLTDSGGFQVYSLSSLRGKIEEKGVTFASHVDGHKIFMGPEESIRIQSRLGSTIAMAFDECAPSLAEESYLTASVARTTRWLDRCIAEMKRLNEREDTLNKEQMLFGINQGGVLGGLRVEHAKTIAEKEYLSGFAIGGLAVGETADQMYHILEVTIPYLPQDKPTYLMGVGTPENILEAVWRGVDFFDCVMPARNGRHGHVYTNQGKLNLWNEKYLLDDRPIGTDCDCPVCRRFSRAYIRHLLKAGEMLGMRLCVMHNLYYYNHLMEEIRTALDEGRFDAYRKERLEGYKQADSMA